MAAMTAQAHAAGALVRLGPGAQRRRAAGRPERRRRRLRDRLRLQVPQRRPGRAGLRVGASAPRRALGWQPLSGWMGHAAPFKFAPATAGRRHRPLPVRHAGGAVAGRAGMRRRTLHAPPSLGGMAALREKSVALDRAVHRAGRRALRRLGFALASPRDARARGSQVSLAHADGYAIMQALIARGVIGDFRAGTRRRRARPGAARHPALRLHAAVHCASSTSATPSSTWCDVLATGGCRADRVRPRRAAVT